MDTLASPASLSFEPAQTTVSPGNTFEINLNIFTDNQSIISTDVWIQYDPTLVQPVLPAKSKGIFETTEAKIVSPGLLYVYGLRRDPLTAGAANGTMTTLSFKSLKEGVVTLTFDCPLIGSPRSQIIKNDATLSNILNCERTQAHTSTISIANTHVLGATDNVGGTLNMWYLTIAVALLTITTFLYIRTKKLAKEEVKTNI